MQRRRGFSLVEVLLTICILVIIMAAMVPFVRAVHSAWLLGDRETTIQQNARAGLDMMSRLVREAKRITGIPSSGSGNFIKFRNSQDTQTIIFFHNLASSPYYIGNTGLVRVGDLVMRTITSTSTTNSLLAKSLTNFNIDFRDIAGQLTTQPYNASSLDISMRLSDPEGLGAYAVDIFSNISLRPDVKIDWPVWVAAAPYAIELSRDTWVNGIYPSCVSVNSATGECWVAEPNNNRVRKLSSSGTVLITVTGFRYPYALSVNSTTGECWVADTNNNRVRKLSSSGTVLATRTGFNRPYSISVNSATGECWVADTNNNRVRKLSSTGTVLVNVTGFRSPYSVSVNSTTGECWVADTGNKRVRKLSSSGTVLATRTGFNWPYSVSASITGECWVADTYNNRVRKLSSSGAVSLTVTGFNRPYSVSATATAECWVADYNNNRVIKLNSSGNTEFNITAISRPLSISALVPIQYYSTP